MAQLRCSRAACSAALCLTRLRSSIHLACELRLVAEWLGRCAVGDVPLEWYRAEEHVGYDVKGLPIARRPRPDRCVHLLLTAAGEWSIDV